MKRILGSFFFVLLVSIAAYFFHLEDSKVPSLDKGVDAKVEESSIYLTDKFIVIGDSRTVDVSEVVEEPNIFFISKDGVTCNYLWETAEKEVDKLIQEYPDEHFSIFINLGVNDLIRVQKLDNKKICDAKTYASYIQKLKEKWQDHNVFYVSVNPVDLEMHKKGPRKGKATTTNEAIENFNQEIVDSIQEENIFYCDTYTYLQENGFGTADGLHYSENTSKEIMEQLKNCYQKQTNIFDFQF